MSALREVSQLDRNNGGSGLYADQHTEATRLRELLQVMIGALDSVRQIASQDRPPSERLDLIQDVASRALALSEGKP